MTALNYFNHALHNEKVCNYLNKYETYTDWVITTAFYCSMHFIRHLMVPKRIDGFEYKDFEDVFIKEKMQMEGRHGFQKRYVQQNHPDISYEYDRLHDFSRTARYTQYQYTRDNGKMARDYMDTIKRYILRTKP